MTASQNSTLHILLNNINCDKELKAHYVKTFTGGRETSSKKMTDYEAKQLIDCLRNYDTTSKEYDKGNKMRRSIIATAREMGWHVVKDGKQIADMPRINEWCKKQFGKKELKDYEFAELRKLKFAMKEFYKWYLANL